MPELEKVIKGLEYHSEGNCFKSDDDETGCPYWKDSFCSQHLCSDALALLKAQEPETSDALKPDDNVGCWYDITHNYTLEQVVSALKSRELCEDAVSRKYLLDQSYSIKFQTIDESDEEAYREKVVCVEDIEDAPSVQPISVARVMTLEEVQQWIDPVWIEGGLAGGTWAMMPFMREYSIEFVGNGAFTLYPAFAIDEYNKTWRCWTSKPSLKQMEETPWK